MSLSGFTEISLPEFNDSKGDQRLIHSLANTIEDAECLIGCYPDDEGVANNGGRVGAAEAPETILKYLLRMTPPGFSTTTLPILGVAGRPGGQLSHFEKLQAGRKACSESIQKGKFWIGLGGGHDFGYCEGAGFLEQYQDSNPLIVNFDAHLDVREFDKEKITSGTPFFRLLEEFDNFEFIEVGVRDFCNRSSHKDYVLEKRGKVLTLEEIRRFTGSLNPFKHLLSGNLDRPCFVSVDIDVFASHLAMGCSQSWPSGMTLAEFYPIYDFLFENFQVKTLGVYEVSPRLDLDNRTSKLAAELVYSALTRLHGS